MKKAVQDPRSLRIPYKNSKLQDLGSPGFYKNKDTRSHRIPQTLKTLDKKKLHSKDSTVPAMTNSQLQFRINTYKRCDHDNASQATYNAHPRRHRPSRALAWTTKTRAHTQTPQRIYEYVTANVLTWSVCILAGQYAYWPTAWPVYILTGQLVSRHAHGSEWWIYDLSGSRSELQVRIYDPAGSVVKNLIWIYNLKRIWR